MTPFLQFIFLVAIILLAAKTASYISVQLGQPSVLGELIIGLILGPTLINITHLSFITSPDVHEFILQIGELGVLLLMFIAGMELHLSELTKNVKAAALAGIIGVIIPVGLGYALGLLLDKSSDFALFLGLSLGATSVSISAQTLIELKVLNSRVGLTLLGAAVFDDILVILLLSILLALLEGGSGIAATLLILGKMLAFLALSAGFGVFLLPKISRAVKQLNISQGPLSLAIIIMIFFGLASELLGGMAAITGTFLAGLMYSRIHEKSEIEPGIRAVAYGFFVPVFFVSIGMGVNIRALGWSVLWEVLLISILAIVGKLIGSGIGARLGGLSNIDSLRVSIGMISRGEVGLIISQIGLNQGMLDNAAFSSIIAMVIITTLVTPPLLRLSYTIREKTPPTSIQKPRLEDSV